MTWNSADKTPHIVLSNADRQASIDVYNNSGAVRSKYGLSSGKWYVEFYFTGRTDSSQFVGFSNLSHAFGSYPGNDTNSWGLQLIRGTGTCTAYHNGSGVAHTLRVPGTSGAIVGMALDLDNKKVWYTTTYTEWDGDPVAGTGYAHSFTGNTDTLYLEVQLAWNSTGQAVCLGGFAAADQQFAAPTGYLPIAEGWPLDYIFESGAFAVEGQVIDLSGGYYPVYGDLLTATFTMSGQPIGKLNAPYASTAIQLDHELSDESLILMRSEGHVLTAYCHPDQFNRGASGYLNQLLTGGKWFVGFTNFSPDFVHEHPYDAVRCGLIRGTESLNRMLGDEKTDDTYMVSFGAWNSNMRYHRAGTSTAFGYTIINYNDYEGLAIDLTDPTDGRLWVHNDGVWLNGDPVAGTGGIQIIGAWYLAISVKNKFQISLGASGSLEGFTALPTQNQWITDGLWGGNSVSVDGEGTITPTDVRLSALAGNHLLRSAVWTKRGYYYLGLLTSMDPLVEVTKTVGGYQRQMITAGNITWTAEFLNLVAISFPPCSETIVGWALFWYYSREAGWDDPVLASGGFPVPLVMADSQPGLTIPPGSFTWTID